MYLKGRRCSVGVGVEIGTVWVHHRQGEAIICPPVVGRFPPRLVPHPQPLAELFGLGAVFLVQLLEGLIAPACSDLLSLVRPPCFVF